MTTAYFLIILFSGHNAAAMTSTPMLTLEACKQAAKQAKQMEGTLSVVKTQCVATQ